MTPWTCNKSCMVVGLLMRIFAGNDGKSKRKTSSSKHYSPYNLCKIHGLRCSSYLIKPVFRLYIHQASQQILKSDKSRLSLLCTLINIVTDPAPPLPPLKKKNFHKGLHLYPQTKTEQKYKTMFRTNPSSAIPVLVRDSASLFYFPYEYFPQSKLGYIYMLRLQSLTSHSYLWHWWLCVMVYCMYTAALNYWHYNSRVMFTQIYR